MPKFSFLPRRRDLPPFPLFFGMNLDSIDEWGRKEVDSWGQVGILLFCFSFFMSFLSGLAKSGLVDKVAEIGGQMLEKHLAPSREGTATDSSAKESWHPTTTSGKKRAVLVGINYFGTKAELRGIPRDILISMCDA
jgi:hypothetical protein